jgi:hypothetical protein
MWRTVYVIFLINVVVFIIFILSPFPSWFEWSSFTFLQKIRSGIVSSTISFLPVSVLGFDRLGIVKPFGPTDFSLSMKNSPIFYFN